MRDEMISVPAPGKAAWVVLFGFGWVLPLGILGAVLISADLHRIGAELFIGFALALLLTGWISYACWRFRDVTLKADHLLLRATMFRKKVPYASIRPDSLRSADSQQHPEFRTLMKTGGVGLPGLRAGSFRLKGGKKAFVLITDSRVVAFQLDDDSRVLFSAHSPDRAVEAIRHRLPGQAADAGR